MAASSLGFVEVIRRRTRAPLAIVLGSPAEAARLVSQVSIEPISCYQQDLYQAERLREAIAAAQLKAEVVAAPDLWDLPGQFQTVLYPAARGGERALKIDMVEQASHLLLAGGSLIVISRFARDPFFPGLLKKVLGNVHATRMSEGTVFWSERERDGPRRRHEMVFHARIAGGPSCVFVSRPGVFSYGEMDEGARALMETTEVNKSERIADLGCGCGTNGVFAGLASGAAGFVLFVDSNLRAVALAELNACANGLTNFQTAASADLEGLPDATFDLVLANPLYYAHGSIAQLFIQGAHRLLKTGGRLALVTKQIEQVSRLVEEVFSEPRILVRRGYAIFQASKK